MELSIYSSIQENEFDLFEDLFDNDSKFIDDFPISESDEEDRHVIKTDSEAIDQNPGKLICVVCGDIAHGHNFDQITCESCKAFFRRNALKELSRMKCRYSGCCVINPVTRRLCSHCRLKKCFEMKMRKDWIRTDREKQLRALFKRVKEQNKSNDHEVALLSVKDFDLVQRRKKRLNPPNSSLTKTIQTLSIHRDLCENDQIVLTNVSNAFANGKDLVDFSHITNPGRYTCMADFLNHESRTYKSFIQFLKSVRDFHELDLRDQILLVKRNSSTLIFLHHVLASGFYEHPFLQSFGEKMMGYDFQNRITTSRKRFDCFTEYPRIMMLAMIVFSFAGNLSIPRFVSDEIQFDERKKILLKQNFYLELLWKYLSYLYKDEDKVRRSIQVIVIQILRFQTVNAMLEDHLCADGQPPPMHPLLESVYRFT